MEDQRQLLIKVAYYYYRKGFTQGTIANKLHMSRQRVNRLIKKAWEEDIVSINIYGLTEGFVELESQLEEVFGLKRVIIIPNSNMDRENLTKDLGIAGADYLMSNLNDNITIGVAWGKTLYNIGTNLPTNNQYKGISVIQLVGGLNSGSAPKQSDEITRIVANKLDAQPYFIFAPTYLNSNQAKEVMMKEESIKVVFDKMKECDIIIYSIGEIGGEYAPFKKGMIQQGDNEIILKNAVGNICMWYFDEYGKILDISIHKRLMSIDIPTLQKVPDLICVAGGKEKEKSILAGIRGGMMNTLITDDKTARNLLNMELKI